MKSFSLTIEGEEICTLDFDDKNLGACKMKKVPEVIIFCTYIVNLLSDLYVYKNQTQPQGQVH